MQTVTLILTEEEATAFKLFQKHYDLFKNMEANGLSTIEYGKFTLNFAFGKLQNVVKEESIYRLPTERRVNR